MDLYNRKHQINDKCSKQNINGRMSQYTAHVSCFEKIDNNHMVNNHK